MPPKQIGSGVRMVRVTLELKKRGGRKTILPNQLNSGPTTTNINAFAKALAKANRWRRQIEDGEYSSIRELSRANGVNESYACRILRLSLLSPSVVEVAIGHEGLSRSAVAQFWNGIPLVWADQFC